MQLTGTHCINYDDKNKAGNTGGNEHDPIFRIDGSPQRCPACGIRYER